MYKEYFAYGINGTIPSGSTYTSIVTRLDDDADFELYAITYYRVTAIINTKIYDSYKSKYITGSNPILLDSMAGEDFYNVGNFNNTFIPYILPITYTFKKASNLIFEFSQTTGSSVAINMVLHGAKIREGIAPWLIKQYNYEVSSIYTLNRGWVATSGTYSDAITIDDSSDFLVTQIICDEYQLASTISIEESWSSKKWNNSTPRTKLMGGIGMFNNKLPVNRFIPKSGTVVVSFTNSTQYTSFALGGIKLFE